MGDIVKIAPITFDGCAGWVHHSSGDVGVVICSPLGLEDLCFRRAGRMLASLCAEAGYPTLRFDPPGCGDSLGDLTVDDGLDALVEAARKAADALRRATGVERLVLAGQGLGAAVAALAASRVRAEGLALFAPPTSGREHLRELGLWGRWVSQGLGIAPDPEAGGAGGFRLPAGLRAEIESLDLRETPDAPAPQVFIAGRPRLGDVQLAEHLEALGAEVHATDYDEHAAALEAPTMARPPLALFHAVLDWLKRSAPIAARRPVAGGPAAPARLEGEGFVETLVRFGPGDGLAGVLCEPDRPRAGATLLFLNSGGDPHIGWARSTVEHARGLGARGLASFRIDFTGLGDSDGPVDGGPPSILDPQHVEDALAAVDWLETRGLGPVVIAGRCSGADVAFSAAVRDARVRDLVLVNQPHFAPDLEQLAERPASRLAYYLERTRHPFDLLRRFAKGEVDVEAALDRLGRAAGGLGLAMVGFDRHAQAMQAASRRLDGRGARITFLYSSDDPAYASFQAAFGPDGQRLRTCRGVELQRLEGVDTALTAPQARAALLELLVRRALAAA